jgi:signal transduction histidine kinase
VVEDDSTLAVAHAYAQLLSLAVHEFRTPASVVGGYLRMLQRDPEAPLSERQRKMVEEAEKSCARIVNLIAELSDISKLDAGLAAIKDEPFDLFALAEEVAASVHEAGDREVHLTVRGDRAGATVTGDLTRMRGALEAIFRAVLREQPSSGTVVVDRRLVADGGRASAVLAVASEQTVQSSYDAAPGPFLEKRGGLGLALPLARRAIERLGGRVWSPASANPDGDTASERGAILLSIPLAEHSR